MRKTSLLLFFAATLGMASAQEQPETITVVANANPLVGVWKLSLPFNAGNQVDSFCRIERIREDFKISCFGFSPDGRPGSVETDGTRVRLDWGVISSGRLSIVATLKSPEYFVGSLSVRYLFLFGKRSSFEATGTKIAVSTGILDAAGKAPILERIMKAPQAATSFIDAAAVEKNGGKHFDFKGISNLGELVSISYLGTSDLRSPPPIPTIPNFFAIYYAQFSKGARICGLHQDANGIVDGLNCI